MSEAAVRVTVISPMLLRIEYAPSGRLVDAPSLFAINGPLGEKSADDPDVSVHTTPARAGSPAISVTTSGMAFEYVPDGREPHAGNMRAKIRHPSRPADVPGDGTWALWTPESRNIHNLGGTLSTLDGLREAAPLSDGLLARDGWHVVDDQTALLVDGWVASRESLGCADTKDWYLFGYGDQYEGALSALGQIGGRVPMPRKYALGSWFSRYWPYSSDEFKGIVEEYTSHGFPLDVMVLDMDWHKDGWTGWSWNRELIHRPEELLEWMHAQGLAVTLNLHPADGVGPHEDRYAEFMHAIRREPDGSTVPFDAGDRTYMRALFEHMHAPLERPAGHPVGGVDFWWVDWQQDKYVRSIPSLTNLRWLNELYARHTRRERGTLGPDDGGTRPLSFSRWAGGLDERDTAFGDHRHPVHFSGDAHTGWKMLQFQVPFTVTAGNVGCFYWSHDIGGHFGPRFEEATARWVQFGALSPVLRLHSARSETLDRRPWTYERPFCDAMRKAFALRSQLMPTIYSAARSCSERMLPLLRPMYLSMPKSERAHRAASQYMLGDDLLCAPIVTPGLGAKYVASRHVWLPGTTEQSSSRWHDLSSGEAFDAAGDADGRDVIVSAAIDHVPMFVRAGVSVAMQPPTMRMGSVGDGSLAVRLFPGDSGQRETIRVYEDDGVSLAHEAGHFATTPITARWAEAGGSRMGLMLKVGPTSGQFEGQHAQRVIRVELGCVADIVACSVNGRGAGAKLEPSLLGGSAVISASTGIREPIEIELVVTPADAGAIGLARRSADLANVAGVERAPTKDLQELRKRTADAVSKASATDRVRAAALLRIGAGVGIHAEGSTLRVINSLGIIDGERVEIAVIDRTGSTESVLAKQTVVATPSHSAEMPIPDAALGTPPLGVRIARIARGTCGIDGRPLVFEHVLETALRPLTAFSAVGPFDWDWRWSIGEQVHGPEAAPIDPHAAYPGKGGRDLRWMPAQCGGKWAVNFRTTFANEHGLAYAATRLTSPIAQRVTIAFDSSDKLEAFVDGMKVFSLDAFDGHAAAIGSVTIDLPKGESVLLIKCSEGGGGWGFTATVQAETMPLGEAPL